MFKKDEIIKIIKENLIQMKFILIKEMQDLKQAYLIEKSVIEEESKIKFNKLNSLIDDLEKRKLKADSENVENLKALLLLNNKEEFTNIINQKEKQINNAMTKIYNLEKKFDKHGNYHTSNEEELKKKLNILSQEYNELQKQNQNYENKSQKEQENINQREQENTNLIKSYGLNIDLKQNKSKYHGSSLIDSENKFQLKKECSDPTIQKNNNFENLNNKIEVRIEELNNIRKEKNIGFQKNEEDREKVNHYKNHISSLESQIRVLLENLEEKESQMKRIISENHKLKEFEKLYKENLNIYEETKKNIMKEKLIDLANCKSFAELVSQLYALLVKMKHKSTIPKVNFVENMPFESNCIYTGPVINNNIPNGAGMLMDSDKQIKVIGEFENGKIKHNLGIWIKPNQDYLFGQIKMGISLSPILYYFEFNEFKGKSFYLGDIKNYEFNGKGKLILANGDYYEGGFKKGKKKGKGKYFWAHGPNQGDYYEGEFKKNIKKGRKKICLG